MKQNKLFLPPSSARVRRTKTTEEIFIFHDCSLHKLPVKCLWSKEAPGFLLLLFFFFSFFLPWPRSVIWNIGRSVSTQNLPPPLPPSCHTQWKHIWQAHMPTHTNICTCTQSRQKQTGEHVRGHTHTHLYFWRVSGKCNFLCRMERGGGLCCWDWREQITLPAVEDSGRKPKSGLLFRNTHTCLGREEGGGGLQSVFVCGHLCGQRNYGEESFMYINAAFKVTNLSQFPLVLNRCGCSSCFQNWSSNPISVKSLCLPRSLCVCLHLSRLISCPM